MMHPSVISDYMQPTSRTVERDDPLAVARRTLLEDGIRQIPVLSQERLCGVLTDRDLQLAESTRSATEDLTIGQIMSTDFYPVRPLAPLAHVVRSMAIHGYQCAVVVDQGGVKGVFSAGDAMRALADFLEQQAPTREGIGPGEVRAVILTEHAHVNLLIERLRAAVRLIQQSNISEPAVRSLRSAADQLLLAMNAHLELEDQALAPALSDLPGYGRERLTQLTLEHRLQTTAIHTMVNALSGGEAGQSPQVLAGQLESSTNELAGLMKQEEELLLNLDLLRDDGIVTECTSG